MAGDNFSVRVVAEGAATFESAVRMAFSTHKRATHYRNGSPQRKCDKCFGKGAESILLAGQYGVVFKDRKWADVMCSDCSGSGIILARESMILYWSKPEDHVGASALPFFLESDGAVQFLKSWLATALYPPQPNHDGSNGEGFEVTTGDFWGHCEGSHYSIVGVYPDWQMYGK